MTNPTDTLQRHEMLVLYDAKYMIVDRNPYEMSISHAPECIVFDNGPSIKNTQEFIDRIWGRLYIRPDGKRVVIGVSDEIQDIMGITEEAFLNKEKEVKEVLKANSKYWEEITQYKLRIAGYRNSGFWKRLKWAFKALLKRRRDEDCQSGD